MRDIRRSREWRDNDERYPDAVLIEAVDTGFSGQNLRAKQLLFTRAIGALRTITGSLRSGRIGQVGAFSGWNAVWRDRGGRSDVVVEATMLVVSPDDDRVLPVGPAANRIDYAYHQRLSGPDV